jgi:hypothetical protein
MFNGGLMAALTALSVVVFWWQVFGIWLLGTKAGRVLEQTSEK